MAESPHYPGDALRARREGLLATRSIGIPIAIVRRFFQVNGIRKSMLIAFNLFICGLPLLMIAFSFLSSHRKNLRLGTIAVETFDLHGATAATMKDLFASNTSILGIASLIVIVTLLISGFDIADAVASTYGEAFQTAKIRGISGQLRGFCWFALAFAHFGLSQFLLRNISVVGVGSWVLAAPAYAWISWYFWLLTPRLMLDRKLDREDLVPGAWMGAITSTLLWVVSVFILKNWFDWYGRGFGGIGIALAIISWCQIVAMVWVTTICGAAVWWERTAEVQEVIDLQDSDPKSGGSRSGPATR